MQSPSIIVALALSATAGLIMTGATLPGPSRANNEFALAPVTRDCHRDVFTHRSGEIELMHRDTGESCPTLRIRATLQ